MFSKSAQVRLFKEPSFNQGRKLAAVGCTNRALLFLGDLLAGVLAGDNQLFDSLGPTAEQWKDLFTPIEVHIF